MMAHEGVGGTGCPGWGWGSQDRGRRRRDRPFPVKWGGKEAGVQRERPQPHVQDPPQRDWASQRGRFLPGTPALKQVEKPQHGQLPSTQHLSSREGGHGSSWHGQLPGSDHKATTAQSAL